MPSAPSTGGTVAELATYIVQLAAKHDRIAITGRPGIGKTYALRQVLGVLEPRFVVESADELLRDNGQYKPWSEQMPYLVQWAYKRPRWILEGVAAGRALRHGLPAQALLVCRGNLLRPQLSIAALRLGDQVMRWVAEIEHNPRGLAVYTFNIQERKVA